MYQTKDFVSEMISRKSVTIYTIPNCSFCKNAMDFLEIRDISPVVKPMIKESSDIESLMASTKSRTFPQIFVDDVYIGGFSELKKTSLDLPTLFRKKEISGEIKESMCIEEEEDDRFILLNEKNQVKYADIWLLYKKQLASFWTVDEVDLIPDILDWEKSSDNEKHFIKHILAFFASLDQIVMENIGVNFKEEIVIPQIRSHFGVQECIEGIHADMYGILITTYIKEKKEQRDIIRSIQTMPIIQRKSIWVKRWMNPETASLAERLIGFTCLEGVQFSGAFCAIYWLKKQGKFSGLAQANTLIARDEGLHADASVAIYNHLDHKLPQDRVHEIFRHAVDLEIEFIDTSLPVGLIGINSDSMAQYIKFVGDYWLSRLGYDMVWNVPNPFEWMDMISLQVKTNFFEKRPAEYSMAGAMGDEEDQQFGLDADF